MYDRDLLQNFVYAVDVLVLVAIAGALILFFVY